MHANEVAGGAGDRYASKSPASYTSRKEIAEWMLSDAYQWAERGWYAAAERLARRALSLGVTWTDNEVSPQRLLRHLKVLRQSAPPLPPPTGPTQSTETWKQVPSSSSVPDLPARSSERAAESEPRGEDVVRVAAGQSFPNVLYVISFLSGILLCLILLVGVLLFLLYRHTSRLESVMRVVGGRPLSTPSPPEVHLNRRSFETDRSPATEGSRQPEVFPQPAVREPSRTLHPKSGPTDAESEQEQAIVTRVFHDNMNLYEQRAG